MFTAIDIQKAFSNTNREKLWMLLERLGIDMRLITILETLHSDTKYSCRTHNDNSERTAQAHPFSSTSTTQWSCS